MSQLTPTKNQPSTTPAASSTSDAFIKPADLFLKMRRRTSNNFLLDNSNNNSNSMSSSGTTAYSPIKGSTSLMSFARSKTSNFSPSRFNIHSQSPLKCLNNMTDPSPTKKLPVALRNPFDRPVKRRLNLTKSPTKKSRMLEIDEDANLEPPKMKNARLQTSSPNKAKKVISSCHKNNWTLGTKFKISFMKPCKNWHTSSSTVHRHKIYESPSKLIEDPTISSEAIKNVCTIYQHPYFSWRPLYPRMSSSLGPDEKQEKPIPINKNSQAINMMHKDWCESLSDLTNLLILGRCPYFYLCSDYYTILFKQIPSINPKRPTVQAYISPLYFGMGDWLNKSGITYNCMKSEPKSETSTVVEQSKKVNTESKAPQSVDSGHLSDLSDEEFGEDENDDTSTFLESIGIQDLPNFKSKQKGFIETDSQTTKTTTVKQLAMIEGTDNIEKLVNFIKTNRKHTTSDSGHTAGIPPTLLAPCEFRLGTPQYPDIILQNDFVEGETPGNSQSSVDSLGETSSCNKGPSSILLKGTILPKVHIELHKLLANSDNLEHTCKSTCLEESKPFEHIEFTP